MFSIDKRKVVLCHTVFERTTRVIIFIVSLGLSFRGDDQILGSTYIGIYLGIFKLIAYCDPFQKEHIETYLNKCVCHTNYLSSTICNVIIQLVAYDVISFIVYEFHFI